MERVNDSANSGTILKESVKEVHQDFKDYVNRIATTNTAVLNVQQAVDTLTNLALQQELDQKKFDEKDYGIER